MLVNVSALGLNSVCACPCSLLAPMSSQRRVRRTVVRRSGDISRPSRWIVSSRVSDGERVDDRDPDAVQTAGDLVGVLVELPASVEDGHDDLGGGLRPSSSWMIDRDPAPVVGSTEIDSSSWMVTPR